MTGMSAQDRDLWASARTLADLGELTARWLEGAVSSVPGYCGQPAEETVPLISVLAKLNRAGLVTTASQPAYDGPGYDGAHWGQRAAMEGFAGPELAARIQREAVAARLYVILHDPADLPRWRYRRDRSVIVTRRERTGYTEFGVQLPRRHIRDAWLGYGICQRDAVHALCTAWQVTIIDPEWGRPDLLWPVLAGAVTPPGGPS